MGLLDDMVGLFLIFEEILSGCTNLHSYQQCTMVLISLQPFQYLSLKKIIVILTDPRWYFIVVLICISLIFLPFVTTRMILEDLILSEISHRRINTG